MVATAASTLLYQPRRSDSRYHHDVRRYRRCEYPSRPDRVSCLAQERPQAGCPVAGSFERARAALALFLPHFFGAPPRRATRSRATMFSTTGGNTNRRVVYPTGPAAPAGISSCTKATSSSRVAGVTMHIGCPLSGAALSPKRADSTRSPDHYSRVVAALRARGLEPISRCIISPIRRGFHGVADGRAVTVARFCRYVGSCSLKARRPGALLGNHQRADRVCAARLHHG